MKCFFWQRQDLGEDPLFSFYTPDSCRAALANLRVADNGPPKGHWSGPTPTHTTGRKSQDATPTMRPVAAAALGRTAMDAGARACSTVPGSVCFFFYRSIINQQTILSEDNSSTHSTLQASCIRVPTKLVYKAD